MSNCVFRTVSLLLIICYGSTGLAKNYYDSKDEDIFKLFTKGRVNYVLRYNHVFKDTLIIPLGSNVIFEGGSLSGPIFFNETKLFGNVNLKGSSILGSISNDYFEASWLCAADGITDDAPMINSILSICDEIRFKKGIYRLKSKSQPRSDIDSLFYPDIESHIAIHRNGIKLKGEEGAELVTDMPIGTICIYTLPNQITKSVSDIEITGLSFTVLNNGKDFHQFVHTIKTIGVNGLLIKDCTFNDFWGDAICLSHYEDTPETGERTRNQKILIENNFIIGGVHHNNRNGISVINGKDVIIKNNHIKNTSRKDMAGGIDVEPNNTAYTIENIQILDNVIEGCLGNAGAISIHANGKGGPAHHIRIHNNKIKSCSWGLTFVVKSDDATSDYVVSDNYVSDDTTPYQFVGEGTSRNWTFVGNIFLRPCRQNIPGRIKVANLVLKKNKKKD